MKIFLLKGGTFEKPLRNTDLEKPLRYAISNHNQSWVNYRIFLKLQLQLQLLFKIRNYNYNYNYFSITLKKFLHVNLENFDVIFLLESLNFSKLEFTS